MKLHAKFGRPKIIRYIVSPHKTDVKLLIHGTGPIFTLGLQYKEN